MQELRVRVLRDSHVRGLSGCDAPVGDGDGFESGECECGDANVVRAEVLQETAQSGARRSAVDDGGDDSKRRVSVSLPPVHHRGARSGGTLDILAGLFPRTSAAEAARV